MIDFRHPQLLALLVLLPLAWRFLTCGRPTLSTFLRVTLVALAVLALARPRLGRESIGTDLIVMVDRSASCGDEAAAMLGEIWPLAERGERRGDRTALVAFGDGARVERGFSSAVAGAPATADDFAHASDLAGALRLAAGMRDPERRTAILCLTDGLYTGDSPTSPDILPELNALPFWHRRLGADAGVDVAAGVIAVPDTVEPRSEWVVRYSIHATAPCEAEYGLFRNGAAVERGKTRLDRGVNRFFARDTFPDDGLLQYSLEVTAAGDIIPGNNAGTALLRVAGAPSVLLVDEADEAGLLEQALTAAVIRVVRIRPERFPEEPAMLAPHRLVILENCRLSSFPGRAAAALAEAVRTGVTSLLVTGGPNSFGMGGYHQSPLDPLLPVDMELRNETRRQAMAVAMALDRSGSMAVGTGDGRSKMDLANLGAAESIRLLSPEDQVAVMAVDSSAHSIVPLSRAEETEELIRLTLAIESMGGGIFCRTALNAAGEEIGKSDLSSRHIILFADAADAEEQEGCIALAEQMRRDGITLSVIAMGSHADSDADFLDRLSWAGGGETLFSKYADGLPALFTQEIMRISRRGFIEEPATPVFLPPMAALGMTDGATLRTDGYNVTAARDGAVVHMALDDEFATPLLAVRQDGRTAVGAMMFEADGDFSGNFPEWSGAPEFLVALARRLASGVTHAEIKAYSSQDRGIARAEWEFSPEMARTARGMEPSVAWLGPGGRTVHTPLEWVEPERARATIPLSVPGHYLPMATFPGIGAAPAPAVSLSYSREFAPPEGEDGLAVLRTLAGLSGGGDGLDIGEARRSGRAERTGKTELRPVLLGLIILLFLLELAGRRLLLFT